MTPSIIVNFKMVNLSDYHETKVLQAVPRMGDTVLINKHLCAVRDVVHNVNEFSITVYLAKKP